MFVFSKIIVKFT